MKHHTFKSESALRDYLPKLVTLSCWFEVTPEPDDEWTVSVKDDVAHIAFAPNRVIDTSDPDTFIAPDGTKLVAKPQDGCPGCVFFNRTGAHVHGTVCGDAPACSDGDRADGKSIIWVKA